MVPAVLPIAGHGNIKILLACGAPRLERPVQEETADGTAAVGMTTPVADNRGSIFADPVAYADPVGWHAAAKRIREESPVLKVALENYPEFYAITKHAFFFNDAAPPEIFTNAPLPTMTPKANVRRRCSRR